VIQVAAASVALAATATIAWLGVEVVHQQDRLDRFAIEMKHDPIERAAVAAMIQPGAHVVDLISRDRAWSAHLVMRRDGTGFMMDSNLPRLPRDRTYQLWAVVERDGDSSVIPVSTLGREAATSMFHIEGTVVRLQITEETAPGGISPHQPPVVEAKLPV
jgi:hypothetical protein